MPVFLLQLWKQKFIPVGTMKIFMIIPVTIKRKSTSETLPIFTIIHTMITIKRSSAITIFMNVHVTLFIGVGSTFSEKFRKRVL